MNEVQRMQQLAGLKEVDVVDTYNNNTPLNKPEAMRTILENMSLVTKQQIETSNDNILEEIGLYFWWIHENAVDELNVLFQGQNQPTVKACTWKEVPNKGKYYLVYVGKAQDGSLRSRLIDWHLDDANQYANPNSRNKIASGIHGGGMSSLIQTVAYTIWGKGRNVDITQPTVYQEIIQWFNNHFLYGYLGQTQLGNIANQLGITPQNVAEDIDLYENKFLSHCYGALNYQRPNNVNNMFQRRNANSVNDLTLDSVLNNIKIKVPQTPHQGLTDYFTQNNIQFQPQTVNGNNYYNLNNVTLRQLKHIKNNLGYGGFKWG